MGINLAEVQQKIDRLLKNQEDLLSKTYDIFFNTESKVVELEQLNAEGKLQTVKIPNYSKVSEVASPVGAIVVWPGIDIPENWMACNGKEINREANIELYNIAKKDKEQPQLPFGEGDKVNTFCLPDLTKNNLPGTVYIIRVK
nr:hypothetical protein 12 [bacterium]